MADPSAPDEFHLADLINFGNFHPWIRNLIADSELVFRVGCRAKTDPKYEHKKDEKIAHPAHPIKAGNPFIWNKFWNSP